MAITKVGAMTDPPVAGDYAILQAKLDAYAKQVGNQGMILTQWINTTTKPDIALGSYITHGGTLFIVDTEDFAVTEPAGDGTYYLKVAVSGSTLAISWVASTAGYAWNAIYNGLYHADESQILPYQLVKTGAVLTKRKITNLMQGSGFVTVDYLGAMIGTSIAVSGAISGASIAVSGAITDKNGNEVLAMKIETQKLSKSWTTSSTYEQTASVFFSNNIQGLVNVIATIKVNSVVQDATKIPVMSNISISGNELTIAFKTFDFNTGLTAVYDVFCTCAID